MWLSKQQEAPRTSPRPLRRRKLHYSSDDSTDGGNSRTPSSERDNNERGKGTKSRTSKGSNRSRSANDRTYDTSSESSFGRFFKSIDISYYNIRITLVCVILVAMTVSYFDIDLWTSSKSRDSNTNDKSKNLDHMKRRNSIVSNTFLHNGDFDALIVIMSDRVDGIIPTLASVLKVTTVPVDVVLISNNDTMNKYIGSHFGTRINEFISLTVQDVTEDLVRNGHHPIWTWDDWQSSINNSNWTNTNTIRTGTWDNLMTHAHELNHLRFYLPFLTIFQNKRYFYVIDDDVLVFKDLAHVHNHSLQNLDSSKSLICPCNGWSWRTECLRFEFQNQVEDILSRPAIYGNRHICKSATDSECVPSTYWDFVNSVLPTKIPQKAWNFGFTLFDVKNWKDNDITKRYEHVMKESYRLHVFPETSLSFGLGVPYIALAGSVECWNETDAKHVKVLDGFSFIEYHMYEESFGDNFLEQKYVDVLHYTGKHKPWMDYPTVSASNLRPWLDVMSQENMTLPQQLPEQPTRNLFLLLGWSRSGNSWIMSTLDHHPEICATGGSNHGSTGFPLEVTTPNMQLEWLPECSIQRGCSLSFVLQSIMELTSTPSTNVRGVPRRCDLWYDPITNVDPLRHHLKRLCKFIRVLRGNYTVNAITQKWVEAFVHEDKKMLGCQCSRGVKAKGLLVLPEWLHYKNYPNEYEGPAPLNLNGTLLDGVKVIHIIRDNPWIRYRSMEVAKVTGMFHIDSIESKNIQWERLRKTNITIQLTELEWYLQYSIQADRVPKEWIHDHAGSTLTIDYNQCRSNPKQCFEKIYTFLNVSTTVVSDENNMYHTSTIFDEYPNENDVNLFVTNYKQVQELLVKYKLT